MKDKNDKNYGSKDSLVNRRSVLKSTGAVGGASLVPASMAAASEGDSDENSDNTSKTETSLTEDDLIKLTWPEAEEVMSSVDYVVLPTGSIEQHSIHLPVSVDLLRAHRLSAELVKRSSEYNLSMLRLPTLPYGYAEHHMNYGGTITLSAETYQDVVTDIGKSVKQQGADRLLFLNGHGGNETPLQLVIDRLQRDHGLKTHFVHWTDYASEQLSDYFGDFGGHAGEHETSFIELFYPELVKTEQKESQTELSTPETRPYRYIDETTEQGGWGDPTRSDPEFFEQVVEDTTERILEALQSDIEQDDDSWEHDCSDHHRFGK